MMRYRRPVIAAAMAAAVAILGVSPPAAAEPTPREPDPNPEPKRRRQVAPRDAFMPPRRRRFKAPRDYSGWNKKPKHQEGRAGDKLRKKAARGKL